MKVWIIEQGSYSDYRVVGIFSTKENAELYMSKIEPTTYEEPSIEERDLNPGIEDINAGRRQYQVRFHEDGSLQSCESSIYARDCVEYHFSPITQYSPSEPWEVPGRRVEGSHLYILWAKDEGHAIKIATDRLFQHLAEKAQ